MKDAVDRLTPLGVIVLALLREGDMHPYEMIRVLRQRRDDRLVPITNGTMYHTVARLTRAGLLAEVGTDRDGNRPERTTYSLTTEGRDAVADWVRRELGRIDRPAEFRVALAEAHNLDREEVEDLLTARRAALTAEYTIHRDGLGKSRQRRVPEQYLVEIDRQTALLDAELRWTDEFLARLQNTDIDWGPPQHPETASGPGYREATPS
ncbi:MAG: PadR family transcriptional regulator [Micropruina sp.]|uniref:PadR family transcriptional regulator n=1 Tax=Micropruina sp. TaxID=2737536 RepID=UPI0039E3CEFF